MKTKSLLTLLSTCLGLTLPASARPAQNDGVWQLVNTSSGPGNRVGHSLTVIDNVTCLFGGVTPDGLQNDL